jgi:hypothetical protein
MSIATAEPRAEQIEHIERLIDAGFEAITSALTLQHTWTKIILTAPFGYSPSVEALNLLRRAAATGQREDAQS